MEHLLAKEGVAGSIPVSRSFYFLEVEEQLSLKSKIEVLSIYEEAVAADIECSGFSMQKIVNIKKKINIS